MTETTDASTVPSTDADVADVLLIGGDTFTKTTYVKWEVEVAVEKGCRLIGVNLNNSRFTDILAPWFFVNRGALYVPYSPHIVAKALMPWKRSSNRDDLNRGDWHFYDWVYTGLGYELIGDKATFPKPPNPFRFGKPDWTT